MQSRTLRFILISVIIFTALAIRLIWLFSCQYAFLDIDTATIGQMARHILLGNFPMFFYGQYYLAPIESYLVSILFLIFGEGVISLTLVPLLIMVFTGILIYFLGKEFKNREVGIWAMLYFLFPPLQLFFRSFKSQGYIPEELLIGVVSFLMALRIIGESALGRKRLYYFILGLVSGIGFWITGLVAYFIVAMGIFLLIDIKKSRIFRHGYICAAAFFISGLSYWIFTIRHNFCTFGFAHHSGGDIKEVLSKFIFFDLKVLTGTGLGGKVDILIYLLYGLMLICFFIYTIFKRERNIWLLWLLLLSVVFFYTRPGFYGLVMRGTERYASCLYIFVAVMTGYFGWWLNKRVRYGGTLIISLLLFLNLFSIFRDILHSKKNSLNRQDELQRAYSFLIEKKLDKIVSHGKELRPLLFFSKEKFIAREYKGTNYIGYDDIIEGAPDVSFHIPGFESSLGGVCRGFSSGEGFCYDFKRYPYRYREILPDNWAVHSNFQDGYTKYAIDRDCYTWWSTGEPKQDNMYFQIDLGGNYKISRLQFFYYDHYRNLPERCRILLSSDGNQWQEVLCVEHPQTFFWSGPRLYLHLHYGRCEFIFEPQEARFVKILQDGEGGVHQWEINEIFIYEYAGEDTEGWGRDDLFSAYNFLLEKGVSFIYADFWESSKIREWGKGKVGALRPYNVSYFNPEDSSRIVKLGRDRGFIVSEDNVNGWEKLIGGFDINLSKERFGRYWCYYFSNLSKEDETFLSEFNSIYWLGIGGVKVNFFDYSYLLYKKGLTCEKEGDYKRAIYEYRQALKYYPRYFIYKRLKELGESVSLWEGFFEPKKSMNIEFRNGITLLGASIENKIVRPGGILNIDYFWRIKKRYRNDLAVFVHAVKDDKIIFQGDYTFHISYSGKIDFNPIDVFREPRPLLIPRDIPEGAYKIIAGLWLTDRRLRIKIKDTDKTKIELGEFTVVR